MIHSTIQFSLSLLVATQIRGVGRFDPSPLGFVPCTSIGGNNSELSSLVDSRRDVLSPTLGTRSNCWILDCFCKEFQNLTLGRIRTPATVAARPSGGGKKLLRLLVPECFRPTSTKRSVVIKVYIREENIVYTFEKLNRIAIHTLG